MQQHTTTPYPAPRRKRSRWWLWLIVLAVAYGAYSYFSGTKTSDTKPAIPTLVRVAPVEEQSAPEEATVVGTVVPYESVAVKTRVESQVVKVHFKDGDTVKKGALLFTLDDRELAAQEAQMAAAIARDRATAANAQKRAGRAKSLAKQGFATHETRDDSLANAAVAIANLHSSEAALANIRAAHSFTRITAPISGRTGTVNVTLGNTVRPGDTTPLVTINQLSPIRVQAALPQAVLAPLRDAMQQGKVRVEAHAQEENGDLLAEGTIDYLDNTIDTATGTVIIRAHFDNKDEALWPGMFVTLTIAYGDPSPVLTVPEQAIQHGQQGEFVYVIADGKAEKRAITLARMVHGLAVIRSGLALGESVATDGMLTLKDGGAVRIREEEEAAAPAATEAP